MSIWEQQSNKIAEHKQKWEVQQNFSFSKTLLEAENEEEVKSAYIRQFSLPVKTAKWHDLTVNNVLFEFKYSVNFKSLDVASKVIAQTLYYIHRLFEDGEEHNVSHFIIADKDEAIIFKTSDYEHFYKSSIYDWKGYRPSSPDPKLVNHVKQSRIIESSRIYLITNEDDLQIFTNLLYQIISPNKAATKNSNYSNKINKKDLPLIVLPVILLFLGIVSVVVVQHKAELGDKPVPTKSTLEEISK
ncbi:hypothetical protein IQ229_13355 [Nostoc cf. edaphicum LEGE 07299]|uniref:Uncharacterized protein n=1 Tax=Nostoc cf. edaphicum LEGE 07299 TaxID=2777974 RepID=A0ABR9U0R9_9NOSO|nr:hypothetical protein [Nostoc edaphicum]MBE9105890.1 hypothetical protein [Nostoc cf. edaphicum LEGE 07299]